MLTTVTDNSALSNNRLCAIYTPPNIHLNNIRDPVLLIKEIMDGLGRSKKQTMVGDNSLFYFS